MCVINLCKYCTYNFFAVPAAQQREFTKFCVFWRTRTTAANFCFFSFRIQRWRYIVSFIKF